MGQQLVTDGQGTMTGWEPGVLPGNPEAMLWELQQLWPQRGTLKGNQCSGFTGLGLQATKFHREHDPAETDAGKQTPENRA